MERLRSFVLVRVLVTIIAQLISLIMLGWLFGNVNEGETKNNQGNKGK